MKPDSSGCVSVAERGSSADSSTRTPTCSTASSSSEKARRGTHPVCVCAHTAGVQTPEPAARTFRMRPQRRPARPERSTPIVGSWGVRLAWVSGLILCISAFTDWYAGTLANGLTLSVTGWHSGALGKLVFFVGLATLILEASREAGVLMPAAVPVRLYLYVRDEQAVVFGLLRLISD